MLTSLSGICDIHLISRPFPRAVFLSIYLLAFSSVVLVALLGGSIIIVAFLTIHMAACRDRRCRLGCEFRSTSSLGLQSGAGIEVRSSSKPLPAEE
jgi:hypothetical protein